MEMQLFSALWSRIAAAGHIPSRKPLCFEMCIQHLPLTRLIRFERWKPEALFVGFQPVIAHTIQYVDRVNQKKVASARRTDVETQNHLWGTFERLGRRIE